MTRLFFLFSKLKIRRPSVGGRFSISEKTLSDMTLESHILSFTLVLDNICKIYFLFSFFLLGPSLGLKLNQNIFHIIFYIFFKKIR